MIQLFAEFNVSSAQVKEWPFINGEIDVEAGGNQISTNYEKGSVSRWLDHGGHYGVPVETETKRNAGSTFTAMWPPFCKR